MNNNNLSCGPSNLYDAYMDVCKALSKKENEAIKLKGLLRESYNVITGSTGLDTNLPPVEDSSLLRRIRESINS